MIYKRYNFLMEMNMNTMCKSDTGKGNLNNTIFFLYNAKQYWHSNEYTDSRNYIERYTHTHTQKKGKD